MKTFLLNIRSELLKTKRSSAIWLTLLAGAFIPVILFIGALSRPLALMKYYGADDPWYKYMDSNWRSAVPFLLPIFVILLCSLIAQIEFRNGTWKQVFASPRTYFDIYFSKYIVIILMTVLSLLVFNMAAIAGGYAISIFNSKFTFTDKPIHLISMMKMTSWIFVSVLGMSAIQYWMAVRFRNFIISFGIGFGAMIASMMLANRWEKAVYIPYLYPWHIYMDQTMGLSSKVHDTLLYSVIVCGVVMLVGFIDLVYRKEKA
jgi:hypothetical protein